MCFALLAKTTVVLDLFGHLKVFTQYRILHERSVPVRICRRICVSVVSAV